MFLPCFVIASAILVAILFTQQVRENNKLREIVSEIESLPVRQIFLMKPGSVYMEKLIEISIRAHERNGISYIQTKDDEKGLRVLLFANGDVVRIQDVTKGELQKIDYLTKYDDHVFVDYKVAPDKIFKMLTDAGLRNFVYKFSIIDEEAVK